MFNYLGKYENVPFFTRYAIKLSAQRSFEKEIHLDFKLTQISCSSLSTSNALSRFSYLTQKGLTDFTHFTGITHQM